MLDLLERFPVTPPEDRYAITEKINVLFEKLRKNQSVTKDQIRSLAERAFFSLDSIAEDEFEWSTINAILDWWDSCK